MNAQPLHVVAYRRELHEPAYLSFIAKVMGPEECEHRRQVLASMHERMPGRDRWPLRHVILDGYRVGWQDTLGTIRRAVVENNNKKWSGDHCATATEISGGVFFSNRKITTEEPHIMDLAPSILKLLETAVPVDYDGKSLW